MPAVRRPIGRAAVNKRITIALSYLQRASERTDVTGFACYRYGYVTSRSRVSRGVDRAARFRVGKETRRGVKESARVSNHGGMPPRKIASRFHLLEAPGPPPRNSSLAMSEGRTRVLYIRIKRYLRETTLVLA